jgi:flagellin
VPLRINHNIAALNATRHLNAANRVLQTGFERLSSGLRINRASDDAAGLQIREGLRAEIAGLKVSVQNATLATNLVQTAEGSLGEVNAILIRLRELATQSSTSTISDNNRASIQAEFSQLTAEIDRIAQSTTFNDQILLTGFGNAVDPTSTALTTSNTTGVTDIRLSGASAGTFTFVDTSATDGQITLGDGGTSQTLSLGTVLDGSVVATGTQTVANFDRLGVQVKLAGANVAGATGQFTDGSLDGQQVVIESGTGGSFQIGPKDASFNRLEVSIPDLRASGDALNLSSVSVESQATAQAALTSIDSAVARVAQERGTLGATQNRLSFTISANENAIENVQASESSISDADIALEVTRLTRTQILAQLATSILTQANSLQRQNVATLLQFQGD